MSPTCSPRLTPSRVAWTALVAGIVLFWSGPGQAAGRYPLRFADADGRAVSISRRPERVVCLVPSVTELIFAVGGGDAVAGVTLHDHWPPEAAVKPVMGGFFSPSVERIMAVDPDVVFVADLHRDVTDALKDDPGRQIVRLRLDSVADLYETIALLGRLFDGIEAAGRLVADIRAELDLVARKTAAIPPEERRRVARLMGRNAVMTPGDDSFQTELIRLAGGIPLTTGTQGAIAPVSPERWRDFDPQALYGCGGDREMAESLLRETGWKEVTAMKNGNIRYFPCDLTCRLSARTGHFVASLAAWLYGDAFADRGPVLPNRIMASQSVDVDLPCVASAEILETSLHDAIHKTLLVHFRRPMKILSTLEGPREGIRHAGNGYSPPQVWELYHRIGLEASRRQLLDLIGRNPADTSLLFTGADMGNLSVQRQSFRDMTVVALVTAGVESNAVRMSQDTGAYYEPGTINILLLTNTKLTPRAMNRAVISATEAKTAALQDMDIRSSYTGLVHAATGTGTDNILVSEGEGISIDNAGGHCKMGELIARAVYAGVREAVFRQNGLTPVRPIFRRLKERGLTCSGLLGSGNGGVDRTRLAAGLEKLLLEPRYAGFIESALALSDHVERGLISDTDGFARWCDLMASDVAGVPVTNPRSFQFRKPLPQTLEMAFGALLNGLAVRDGDLEKPAAP